MPVDPATGLSKGFAFIEFTSPQAAAAAREQAEGYKLDKSHAHFPFVYNEIVVLSFVESIEAEKIIKVRNYIERVYGMHGLPADKVELISSHTIEVSLVKVRSTSYESY
jgi:RNA recognition motif-containing protein